MDSELCYYKYRQAEEAAEAVSLAVEYEVECREEEKECHQNLYGGYSPCQTRDQPVTC